MSATLAEIQADWHRKEQLRIAGQQISRARRFSEAGFSAMEHHSVDNRVTAACWRLMVASHA
jgi:hypothetical protein